MNLFYAPDINPPHHTLSAEESRHCVKVLRLSAGDHLHLTDGRGGMYVAEMVRPDPRGCEVRVVESVQDPGRPYRLTMAVAPTKNSDRYEWFLEKATEVGVDVIVPIECSNSERRVFKPERAEKVLVSAMKQSLKSRLPRLEPLTPLRGILSHPFGAGADLHLIADTKRVLPGTADRPCVKLIAHCRPEGEFPDAPRIPLTRALPAATDALILIGPEGDFTAEEVRHALAAGFIPVSLGESRLRTETAALTAVVAAYIANLK